MMRKQTVGILLAGLWLASHSPAGASVTFTSFSGDLAPSNWSAQNYAAAPGSYVFNSDTSLTISASPDTTGSDIKLTSTVALTQISSINLDWSLNDNGSSGLVVYYFVDSTPTALTGLSGVINLDNVAAGSTIAFELESSGTASGKNAANLDLEVVPEAGTWLAGAFVLGVFGFEVWRRKSGTPANLSAQLLAPIGAARNRR